MEGMRQIDAMLPLAEVRDLADEVRRLFDDLDRARTLDRRLLPGVFSPTLDAQDPAEAVEIVVDLPGVASTTSASSSKAAWSSSPAARCRRTRRSAPKPASTSSSAISGGSRGRSG
jgi:hypothetical protein